jgi:hypothetical protein
MSEQERVDSADDCTKVLTQVYEFLDNELDTASGDAIRARCQRLSAGTVVVKTPLRFSK